MTKLFKSFIFVLLLVFTTNSYAAFPEEYSEAKDITLSDKTVKLLDNNVTISYTRPAKPLQPFQISFKFEKDNIKNLFYKTNMIMNMGKYHSVPMKNNDVYITSFTLPKCGSGRTLWYGELDITYTSGKTDKLIFFYNVK